MSFFLHQGGVGPSFGVMTISPQLGVKEEDRESKQTKIEELLVLGFSEVNKMGTFQPHDDALVVTL